MGEIRVPVKLTNSYDEMRLRRGEIMEREVRCYEADAVVDTGTVRSVIPVHVLDKLGLQTRGRRVVQYADGRKESVGISEPIVFDMLNRDTLEEAMVFSDEVLIGQTVLKKLDLLADCANQRLLPNPDHPDQPVSKIRRRREHHE